MNFSKEDKNIVQLFTSVIVLKGNNRGDYCVRCGFASRLGALSLGLYMADRLGAAGE